MGQNVGNLRHLEADQRVGQWRDSTYGIGGGRIPLDVNTGLVPAALYAISNLSARGLIDAGYKDYVADRAATWENNTLSFFAVSEAVVDTQRSLKSYVDQSGFSGGDGVVHNIADPINYYALAFDGHNNHDVVKVMNTDVCFRLFLINGTDDGQLTDLLNSTANNVLAEFPFGLSTDQGLVISNPAFGGDAVYAANWTTATYHGTVVWSWPMAMLARGLERQLARCAGGELEEPHPRFCADEAVYRNVRGAYNHLWDVIDANTAHLTSELWAWKYIPEQGFEFEDYSLLSNTGKFRFQFADAYTQPRSKKRCYYIFITNDYHRERC